MLNNFKKNIPWWLRIVGKILLARLPVPYSMWKCLGLFEHGDMNQPQKALDIIIEHSRSAGVLVTEVPFPRFATTGRDFNVLELGPGDSLFTAVIAKAMGASRTWLVDVGEFAAGNIGSYLSLLNLMQHKGSTFSLVKVPQTLADILTECGADYLTEGVQSLARLPDNSVDFCFSNAVLEHIPKKEFEKLAYELKRVMKPDGVCFHRVDLKDHLGGGLNNLRFSDATWEGPILRNSGFYTNRIRFRKIISILECAGFDCILPRVISWDNLPMARSKMDTLYRGLDREDLLVSGFDIILKHKRVSA